MRASLGPFAPPLVALRELHEQAIRKASSAQDAHVRLLGNIVSFVEIETRNAFKGADVSSVRERALNLGRASRDLWGHLILTAGDLVAAVNVAPAEVMKKAPEGWRLLGEQAEMILPSLPPNARVYVRAVGYLLFSKLGNVAIKIPALDAVAQGISQEQDDGALVGMGLMQALFLFGIEGGLAAGLLEAIGRELWRSLPRGPVDDEDFEDAYLSACADEAKLEGGDAVSLDELMGRAH